MVLREGTVLEWGVVLGGGGIIIYLNYLHSWSVTPARSMLERALTMPVCADVWARSHRKSGITLHSRPKDAALAVIIFHAFIGFRKGDPNNGWIKASRAMVVLQTATVSEATASSLSLGVLAPISAKAESRSTMVGVRTSCTVSQSAWTSTVVGSIPRQTSLAKARTLPSSGVALAKEGVTYCTPQSTLICGKVVSTQVSRIGLSARGKVAMVSRRNLGDVPYASWSKVKMTGKARSPSSSTLAAPSAARVLGAAWVCCTASTGGGCLQGVASGAGMAGTGRRLVALPWGFPPV